MTMSEDELRERLALAEEAISRLAWASAVTAICAGNCEYCRQVATQRLQLARELYPHVQYQYLGVDVDEGAVRRHLFELSHYLSTWCWHGHHDQCKGQCKMVELGECNHQCTCGCHALTT